MLEIGEPRRDPRGIATAVISNCTPTWSWSVTMLFLSHPPTAPGATVMAYLFSAAIPDNGALNAAGATGTHTMASR